MSNERITIAMSTHTITAPARGRHLFLLGTLLAAACALMGTLGVLPAQAALLRQGTFGSRGEGAGQFGESQSDNNIAVNDTTGDVYVADQNNKRVDEFSANGTFLMAWGYGVADGSTDAPQTCTTKCFAGIAGSGEGQFSETHAIAVDNSAGLTGGDVYVATSIVNGHVNVNTVEKYSAEGVYLGRIEPPEAEGELKALSVDATGDLWAGGSQGTDEFDPSGTFVTHLALAPNSLAVDSTHLGGQIDYDVYGTYDLDSAPLSGSPTTLIESGEPSALALDPITGKLYVDHGSTGPTEHTLSVYDDAHNLLETLPTEIEGGSSAMAYDDTTGELYVFDEYARNVVVFKEYQQGPPVVEGESPFKVMKSTATLQAKLNGLNLATSYHFEYGTTTAYGQSTPAGVLPGPDFKVNDLDAEVVGLQPDTVYHFRIVASNSAGTTYGRDETFRTANGFFSFVGFESVARNQDGSLDLRAGSHPYAFTTSYRLDVTSESKGNTIVDGGLAKDIEVDLPQGFVGDPNALPQCSLAEFDAVSLGENRCPDDTAVGFVQLEIPGEGVTLHPLYSLAPPPGKVAEFGFPVLTVPITMSVSVRTGENNTLRVGTTNIPQAFQVTGASFTFWGVPGDASHDKQRGHCLIGLSIGVGHSCPIDIPSKPLLTLPTVCSGPLTTSIRADSWSTPGVFVGDSTTSHDESGSPAPFSGCGSLPFEPSIAVAPDTSSADTPAGVTVDLKMGLGGLLSATGVAPADLEDSEVTLPEGVTINPGQAAGLVACQPSEDGVGTEGPPSCPAASRVGTVAITTPLLADKLEGSVYILPSNPPHLQLLVAASGDSVNLKLIGDVYLDPLTGRLTAKFEQTPPLPFSDVKLAFSGGAQAALTTPTTCGVYSTSFDFTPWSSPFAPDMSGASSFAIDSGPGGSGCSSPLPFAPSMIAGSTSDQAAGFTGFSLLLQRGDGQQRIGGLQFKTPEGLLGMIRGVTLCGQSEAASGECPAASQIGHVVVGAGPGPFPLYVPEPSQPAAPIYLTGPYKGAPYGLSIVVPVIAGPFDLGRIVVRSAISVDPHTARLTISTDPLPQVVAGVPADLRTIDTVIDRPGFMFNPTSCAPMAFEGIASSVQGATAPISSHFQVGSCQSLTFKPRFIVSTSGRTSRRNGASLDAKIVYPTSAPGNNQASSQSNIAQVKVELPNQLPSRLTTLQKACPDSVFNTNPDMCPAASRIGYAKAVTPVLPGSLSGPAYFVSHGGAAFPDLIVVLQGQGIRVDLVGSTFISKQGITSSTFKSVPDVPIYSFELYLPQGPESALTANGDLCKSTLRMPTTFTAQDGAVVKQSTPIAVTGCSTRATHRARKAHRAARTRRRTAGGHAHAARAAHGRGRRG